MITAVVSFTMPNAGERVLGTFTGRSERAILWRVFERWPFLPVNTLRLNGQPVRLTKLPGFRDPETRAKATATIRDPEVQRRKVAARLATEAARRAREAAMSPEERMALHQARSDRHKARWRKYWQEKAARREAAR